MLNQPVAGKASRFIQDVNLLPMDHATIAAKMKIAKSSFSKYYNGLITIPDMIIERFYSTFQAELVFLKKKGKKYAGGLYTFWNERFQHLEVKVDTLVQYNGQLLKEIADLRRHATRVEDKISRSTIKPNVKRRVRQG